MLAKARRYAVWVLVPLSIGLWTIDPVIRRALGEVLLVLVCSRVTILERRLGRAERGLNDVRQAVEDEIILNRLDGQMDVESWVSR